MKKIHLAISVLLISMFLFNTISYAQDSTNSTNTSDEKGITVVKEYSSKNKWGTVTVIGILRNDTGKNCKVHWNALTYDSSGNPLETGESDNAFVSPGQEFALVSEFYDSDDATSYDYNIYVDTDLWLSEPMYDYIEITHSQAKNGKVIVTAKNNSKDNILSCKAIVIFLSEKGKLVDYEEAYLTNDLLELTSGEKYSQDVTCYDEYSSYEVYYTAYKW